MFLPLITGRKELQTRRSNEAKEETSKEMASSAPTHFRKILTYCAHKGTMSFIIVAFLVLECPFNVTYQLFITGPTTCSVPEFNTTILSLEIGMVT